jgi:hypothetical protein
MSEIGDRRENEPMMRAEEGEEHRRPTFLMPQFQVLLQNLIFLHRVSWVGVGVLFKAVPFGGPVGVGIRMAFVSAQICGSSFLRGVKRYLPPKPIMADRIWQVAVF